MSNILFLYERDMPTVSDMRLRFEKMFYREGNIRHVFKSVNTVKPFDVEWLDVLVLIRPDNYLSYKIAKNVSDSGRTVVFFMDDDLFCIPKEALPTIPWKKKALQKNLELSDVFLSSSDYLLNKYGQMTKGKKTVRADSATDEEDIVNSLPKKKDDEIIKIVYAAGNNHSELFEKYVLPILPKLEQNYGKKVSLTFFGAKPSVGDVRDLEVNYIGSMPLKEYRQKMIDSAFDIGLAPLNDDDFSKCKYFNKYIEYTLTGVVGIYSNVEPYNIVIKDGENGFLAENDPESWYQKIVEALNRKKLETMFYKAKQHIVDNFSVETIIERLKEGIPEFFEHPQGNHKKPILLFAVIKYKILRVFDMAYLILYYLRRGGIKKVKEKIVTHKEESKSYR